ncbi:MAG: glycosyltransferase, partial [Tannerellaceae bacterium]|nr:glycosyltransferase [Tannerellaceae bacterium]
MINKKLVSVVIPIYNMEDYLEATVLSVLNSTYPNIEIIMMDDGSSDKSPAIGKQLAEQYSNVFFYCQSNRGVAAARNKAIDLSNGTYIFPLDSDDLIGRDFIEKAVEVMDTQDDVKVVYSRMMFIGYKTNEWILSDFSLHLLARRNVIPASALYRKSDWERVGGYCETIIAREDWEFWISVLKDGGRVVKLPCIGLYYRIRSNSKRVRDRNMKKHVIKILNERHRDFFLRELKGPLRHYRSWSKFMNTLNNFINPFKGIVHPDFFLLSDFVFSLPVVFDKEGVTIYKGRNELKSFCVGGVEYIVKSYMTPIWVNRVIYGFLRES